MRHPLIDADRNKFEADIRRWWMLLQRKYTDGTLWVTDHDWPAWKQIGFLIKRIDDLHDTIRDMELAADEKRPTDEFSAVPRPRPPTSDDTISIEWAPGPAGPALTPVKPVSALPALPVAPAIPPPPQQPLKTLSTAEWNQCVIMCEMAAESAIAQGILHRLHIYDLKTRVAGALKALRKAEPMEHSFSDDAHL